jgi:hypothetical protein
MAAAVTGAAVFLPVSVQKCAFFEQKVRFLALNFAHKPAKP